MQRIATTRAPRFSGAKLQDLRARRKLSQQALCAATGTNLSIATLRRWEQGRNSPSYDDVLRLARLLGVDPGYFSDATS